MDTKNRRDGNPGFHPCHKCGWPFPNPHPSAKQRRAHKKICGTIEGYKPIHSEGTSNLAVSDEEHSEGEQKAPSPKIVQRNENIVGRTEDKSIKSEDEVFSDAVTEFSDAGVSSLAEPTSENASGSLKKVDRIVEVRPGTKQGLKDNLLAGSPNLSQDDVLISNLGPTETFPAFGGKEFSVLAGDDASHLLESSFTGSTSVSAPIEVNNAAEDSHSAIHEDPNLKSIANERAPVPNDVSKDGNPQIMIQNYEDHELMKSKLPVDVDPSGTTSIEDDSKGPHVKSKGASSEDTRIFEDNPKLLIAKHRKLPDNVDSLSSESSLDGALVTAKMIEKGEVEADNPMGKQIQIEKASSEPQLSSFDAEFSARDFIAVEEKKSGASDRDASASDSRYSRDEGCGIRRRQQLDVPAPDVSVDSCSRADSLEGNWGSVSAVHSIHSDAPAIIDAESLPNSQTFSEAENGNSKERKTTSDGSEKFDHLLLPSSMASVGPRRRDDQKATGSETHAVENEVEGRKKKEEDLIDRIANWNTGKQHASLKSLLGEANVGAKPKQTAREWNSPAKYPAEIRKEKKKVKGRSNWVHFVCCL